MFQKRFSFSSGVSGEDGGWSPVGLTSAPLPLFVYLFIGFIGSKALHNYAVGLLRIPAFLKHTLNKNS